MMTMVELYIVVLWSWRLDATDRCGQGDLSHHGGDCRGPDYSAPTSQGGQDSGLGLQLQLRLRLDCG